MHCFIRLICIFVFGLELFLHTHLDGVLMDLADVDDDEDGDENDDFESWKMMMNDDDDDGEDDVDEDDDDG